MDDLAASLRPLPAEVAKVTEAVTRLTEETCSLRVETRSLRLDLSASQRQIAQIGWLLALALVGAIAALLVALV